MTALNAADFPATYKADMIWHYPVIAQMTRDEFYYGDAPDREAAFERILASKNLRRTHELYLEAHPTDQPNGETP